MDLIDIQAIIRCVIPRIGDYELSPNTNVSLTVSKDTVYHRLAGYYSLWTTIDTGLAAFSTTNGGWNLNLNESADIENLKNLIRKEFERMEENGKLPPKIWEREYMAEFPNDK